jgi:hypothetical protein
MSDLSCGDFLGCLLVTKKLVFVTIATYMTYNLCNSKTDVMLYSVSIFGGNLKGHMDIEILLKI